MPNIVGPGSIPGTSLVEDDDGVLREVEERTASRLFAGAVGSLAQPTVSAPEGTFAPEQQQLAEIPPEAVPQGPSQAIVDAARRREQFRAARSAPPPPEPPGPTTVASPITAGGMVPMARPMPSLPAPSRVQAITTPSGGPPTTTRVTQEFGRPISEEATRQVQDASERLAQATAAGMENQATALNEASTRYAQAQQNLDQIASNQAAFEEEFNTRYQDNVGRINRDITDLSTAQINPDRYWKERGTGSKILGGIAVALGALGSTLAGGRNHAWDIISKSIDDDIQAQQHAIATRGAALNQRMSALGQIMAQYENKDQAFNVARAAAMQRLDLQLSGLERTAGSQEIRDKIEGLRAEAQLNAAQSRAAAEQAAAGTVHREITQRTGGGGGTQLYYTLSGGQRIPITSKQALELETRAESQIPVTINGRTVNVSPEVAVKIRGEQGPTVGEEVWPGVRRVRQAPLTPDTTTKLQEADAERLNLNSALSEIENVRRQFRHEWWNTPAFATVRAAYADAYVAYKNMAGLGQIQEQDQKIIDGLIPNPDMIDWAGLGGRADEVISRAVAARNRINNSFNNRLSRFGLAPSSASSFRRD